MAIAGGTVGGEMELPMSSARNINHEKPDAFWGVVLAGGEGRRLQPFMRRLTGCDLPKQFCPIIGGQSMLQHTLDRIAPFISPDRTLIVICRHHVEMVRDLLPAGSAQRLVIQPENRETAPGVLLPLLCIQAFDSTATVAVFPSDHFILEETVFMLHVLRAVEFARAHPDLLILLGIRADRPETGYGWIEPGHEIASRSGISLFQVCRFWEKPDPSTVRRLYFQEFLWNSLVLVGRLGALLKSFRETLPTLWERFEEIRETLGTASEPKVLESVYKGMPPVNLSRNLLEKIPDRLGVVPVEGVLWSDWGEEGRIIETLTRIGMMDELVGRLERSGGTFENRR